jgi:hypothetical protein
MFAQVLQHPSASSSGGPRAVAVRHGRRRSARAVALSLGLLASIGATSAGAVSASAAGKTVSVTCRGGGSSCSAVIGLAGGASNKKLRIALSDTDLKLVGRVVKPSSVRGAYSLSHGSYSLGGSLYTVTLNAVQSIPKGATLTLKFAEPTQSGGGK